jgi:hypothetical protein
MRLALPSYMKMSLSLAGVVGVLLFASGCLSSNHSIPKLDLVRLAHEAPSERGERVRVVQTFVTSEQPPKAQRAESCCDAGGNLYVEIGGHGHGVRGPQGPRSGGSRPTPPKHGGHGPKPKGGSSKGGSSALSGIDGDAAAVLAVIVVASAAAIAVVAASSEGARYDGWAKLEGNHPVHLYGPGNDYRQVPLEQLTVEEAEWATRAYVRKSEGDWKALGRAPLNRQGWAYSVFLGAGLVGEMGASATPGPISHIQLGYFPVHEFGLHADIGFGWGGSEQPEAVGKRFEARAALEAQLLPFQSRRIHAGGFAQIGSSVRTLAAGGGSSDLYSAGALMQLDITTRLALTGRAGVTRAYNELATEMSLGLSIY